jgi:ABC-type cobalamin/Fe3+-siderophores transport system ATPase subunit
MILEVKNLKVVLGGRIILENLNFSVAKGEIFVILGPNGAGKTVLLRTLINLIKVELSVFAEEKQILQANLNWQARQFWSNLLKSLHSETENENS